MSLTLHSQVKEHYFVIPENTVGGLGEGPLGSCDLGSREDRRFENRVRRGRRTFREEGSGGHLRVGNQFLVEFTVREKC